ncbi:MAG: putative transcriptional regulator [Gammaproteobacteria bacterium]|jgi:putative transcriptional regulator
MSALHHPSSAWLLDYAAGTAPPLFETILRAHVGACRECLAEVAFAEQLGGELIANGSSIAGTLTAHDICDRYEQSDDGLPPPSRADELVVDGNIEQFVATYLDSSLDALPWKRLGGGLSLCRLAEKHGAHMWMLRGRPGTVLPEHTHTGSELTLVLKGAYFCGSEIFYAGDVEDADENTEHQPIITRDGECICLAVTEGNLRFNNWLPRLVQPFIGI